MAIIGLPPGSDPGRLPKSSLSAAVTCGCETCKKIKCVCDQKSPPPKDALETTTPVSLADPTPTYSIDSTTEQMDRAAQLYDTAAKVGVTLPRLGPPGSCSDGDSGPCGLWMNFQGNLTAQLGPPKTFGLALPVALSYNSAVSQSSNYGHNWVLNLDAKITTSGSDVVLIDGIGTTMAYQAPMTLMTSGTYYTPPDGARNSLIKTASGWQESQADGFKINYDSSGQLSTLEGNAGTWTCTHGASGVVSLVEDPAGGMTTFLYDTNGNLENILDSAGRSTSITIDGTSGNLTSTTSPETCTTGLGYDANHRLTNWTTPAGVTATYDYDGSGRLTKAISAAGHVTTIAYDSDNMAITNARGFTTTYTLDGTDKLEKQTDALGNEISYTWENNWPKTITDQRGNTHTFTYATLTSDPGIRRLKEIHHPDGGIFTYLLDGNDKLKTLIDQRGNTGTLTWDNAKNERTKFKNALGQDTDYTYSTQYGQLKTIKNPAGHTWTMSWNGKGELEAETNPLGETSTHTYNEAGMRDSTQNAEGETASCTYDNVNRLIECTDPLGNTNTMSYEDGTCRLRYEENPLGCKTSYTYNSSGRLDAVENALGQKTSYMYDEVGNLKTTENALGYVTTNQYDELDRVKTFTNPLGEITTYGYDAAGNQNKVENALGFVTTTTYDGENRVETTENALGYKMTMGYDLAGNLETLENARGDTTRTVFDELNRAKISINPLGNRWTTVYDNAGNAETVENPLGYVTTSGYDFANRPESVTDAEGNTTTTIYDKAGRVKATENALGDLTTNVYDGGRLDAIIDARDNYTSFQYDEVGNLKLQMDPLGRRTSYTYDCDNQRKTRTDARGVLTSFDYNDVGQLELTTYTNDAPVTLTYFATGTQKSMADGTGTTTYLYDAADQLASVENPVGKKIDYEYDDAGQKDKMTDPDGGVFTYRYDPAGNMDYLINSKGERTSWTYDEAGRETLKELDNGTIASMSYDAANRLDLLENRKSNGTVISSFDNTWNKADVRTNVTESNGDRVTWTYDDTYQLNKEERSGANGYNITHQYDPAGNRTTMVKDGTTTIFSYDDANQLETSVAGGSTTTYLYDGAGNLETTQEPSGDVTTSVWDDENRQTTIVQPGGGKTTSVYDGNGMRVHRQSGTSDYSYIWDGQDCLMRTEHSAPTDFRQLYTYKPGFFGRLISQWDVDDFKTFFYLFDPIGSTDRIMYPDETGGNQYIYEAFGDIRYRSGTIITPFEFIGELGYQNDFIANQYYVRARTYSTSLARWLSEDPVGFDGGDFNLYRYVAGNPANSIDPSGLGVWDPAGTREYSRRGWRGRRWRRRRRSRQRQEEITRACPPPIKITWQPLTLSGNPNGGMNYYVFTATCPYKRDSDGCCMKPTITIDSVWEPLRSVRGPLYFVEYFYFQCNYPDGTKSGPHLADESEVILA